jgi:hypothetical protein
MLSNAFIRAWLESTGFCGKGEAGRRAWEPPIESLSYADLGLTVDLPSVKSRLFNPK